MKELLYIGIGGFIGSISRYLMQMMISARLPVSFPTGTLLVNLIGCLLIGLFFGYIEHRHWFSPQVRLFITIGFLGSFTTFSTFAFENIELLREGNYLNFSLYTLISVIGGLLMVWGGYALAR
jgi:CrcB protein